MKYNLDEIRESPAVFAQVLANIKLHNGQKKILECKDRFIAVRAARRFGKSFVFSIYALHFAATNYRKNVVIVSRSMRQSTWMFEQVVRIAMDSYLKDSIVRQTRTEMEFSNGSKIQCLPGASYDALRGITIDLVLVDEAAYVLDELFNVIYPTVISTKGRVVLISTPGLSAGEFYEACMSEKSPYTKFTFTHKDAVFEDGTPLVDPGELERECMRCGGENSPEWKREYLVEFTDADGAFFDIKAVQDSMYNDLPRVPIAESNHKYAIGADIGQKNDFTVFAVIDYTNPQACRLVDLVRFNGETTDTIMYRLHETAMRYNAKRVLIDSAGIGQSIIEHLHASYPGIRYDAFNFNRTTKPKIMTNLNLLLVRHHLQLLQDKDILTEMASFFYKENPETKHISMSGANGVHDDIPIAIALAVEAAGVLGPYGELAFTSLGSRDKKSKVKRNRVLL